MRLSLNLGGTIRVLFTGGSGKAGKHVVAYLAAAGHRVLNFDRVALNHPGLGGLIGDITDAGQIYSAMQAYAGFDEMEPGTGAKTFDAVVHFAAIPRLLLASGVETYRVNAMGTYNNGHLQCDRGGGEDGGKAGFGGQGTAQLAALCG